MLISSFFQITRAILSFAVAISALTGLLLLNHKLDLTAVCVFMGVFFLSCSASVLNQLLEIRTDSMMERTRFRPLPSHMIKTRTALVLLFSLGLTGAVILLIGTSFTATALGLGNLLLYNFVYTPLKKHAGFALFIGAITGAVPPLIGWTAGGGDPFSPGILSLALFMYLWQFPHFLILYLQYQEEYRKAGFPAMLGMGGKGPIKKTFMIFLALTVLSTLLLYFSKPVHGAFPLIFLLSVDLFILSLSYFQIRKAWFDFKTAKASLYFFQIAIYFFMIIL